MATNDRSADLGKGNEEQKVLKVFPCFRKKGAGNASHRKLQLQTKADCANFPWWRVYYKAAWCDHSEVSSTAAMPFNFCPRLLIVQIGLIRLYACKNSLEILLFRFLISQKRIFCCYIYFPVVWHTCPVKYTALWMCRCVGKRKRHSILSYWWFIQRGWSSGDAGGDFLLLITLIIVDHLSWGVPSVTFCHILREAFSLTVNLICMDFSGE